MGSTVSHLSLCTNYGTVLCISSLFHSIIGGDPRRPLRELPFPEAGLKGGLGSSLSGLCVLLDGVLVGGLSVGQGQGAQGEGGRTQAHAGEYSSFQLCDTGVPTVLKVTTSLVAKMN